ncbi:hypothetical protein FHG64_07265 [Antarcticibacterium flavum]|uniref:Prenyltransferase n=1 Tax=Antarcticibacterium flavum TaxID=2058175 RepID=A0A5B7X3I6_9FLAO|nr:MULTISPECIES: hypothetical protein [Antarcticibacterium]MCM4160476.1 hypothetical protein [Antarcticibacterium sp. W02-3]QCY69218.1 hypothetical protein FHG64_07265 [Antarcticibacterium flavum]
MSLWKKSLDFYINSSIHLSLAIVALAAVTCLNFRIPFDLPLLLFIFFASVTGYNFIKYAGIARLHHFSLAGDIRMIQVFSLFIFVGLIISAFFLPINVLILAAVMGLFTLLYALPVFNENRNLRALPGVKIYVIAFVVSGVTVLMPLNTEMGIFQWDVLISFLQRFLIVIALVLPFEIRDLKYDMAQLGTIPQILGVRRTRQVGYLLILLFFILEFLKQSTDLASVTALFLLTILTFFSLKNAVIRQSKYYASFWVEAVPIGWFLSLFFAKILF